MSVDPITCHILDTTLGKPAEKVTCVIYYLSPLIDNKSDENAYKLDENRESFGMSRTDSDGRIKRWTLNPGNSSFVKQEIGVVGDKWVTLKPGIYKIKFLTGKYFHDMNEFNRTFFPFVDITFQIENPPDHHYHVPLLLSNHSYSTYRGS